MGRPRKVQGPEASEMVEAYRAILASVDQKRKAGIDVVPSFSVWCTKCYEGGAGGMDLAYVERIAARCGPHWNRVRDWEAKERPGTTAADWSNDEDFVGSPLYLRFIEADARDWGPLGPVTPVVPVIASHVFHKRDQLSLF